MKILVTSDLHQWIAEQLAKLVDKEEPRFVLIAGALLPKRRNSIFGPEWPQVRYLRADRDVNDGLCCSLATTTEGTTLEFQRQIGGSPCLRLAHLPKHPRLRRVPPLVDQLPRELLAFHQHADFNVPFLATAGEVG